MISQYISLLQPVLLTIAPGVLLVGFPLAEVTLTAENIGVFIGLFTILGSILVVYVRNETRAAVQSTQIEDIRSRLVAGDTQMDGLKRSVDGLRLTMERLITLEEARSHAKTIAHNASQRPQQHLHLQNKQYDDED